MRWLAVALVLASSSALAQGYAPPGGGYAPPPPEPNLRPGPMGSSGFIGGGMGFGGDHFLNGSFHLEGGFHVPGAALWVAGIGNWGGAVDSEGGGSYSRAAIGLEGRQCSGIGICGYLSLSGGYQTEHWEKDGGGQSDEHHHGALALVRFGVDLGNARAQGVRFRAGVDTYRWHHQVGDSTAKWISGFQLNGSVGYQF